MRERGRARTPNEERGSDVIRSQNERGGGDEKLAGERITVAPRWGSRALDDIQRIILSRSHHKTAVTNRPILYETSLSSVRPSSRSLRRSIYHPRLSIYYRPRRLPSLLSRVNTRFAETNSLRETHGASERSDSSSRPSDEILRGFRRYIGLENGCDIAPRYFYFSFFSFFFGDVAGTLAILAKT